MAADVRTQGQYQSMDKRFIGLIFSVFSEDKHSKVGGERRGREGKGGEGRGRGRSGVNTTTAVARVSCMLIYRVRPHRRPSPVASPPSRDVRRGGFDLEIGSRSMYCR